MSNKPEMLQTQPRPDDDDDDDDYIMEMDSLLRAMPNRLPYIHILQHNTNVQ